MEIIKQWTGWVLKKVIKRGFPVESAEKKGLEAGGVLGVWVYRGWGSPNPLVWKTSTWKKWGSSPRGRGKKKIPGSLVKNPQLHKTRKEGEKETKNGGGEGNIGKKKP